MDLYSSDIIMQAKKYDDPEEVLFLNFEYITDTSKLFFDYLK